MTKHEERICIFLYGLMCIGLAGGIGLLLAFFMGTPRIGD